MARRFRFAVQLDEPLEGLTWADSCRAVEGWGYSTLMVPDHFDEGIGPITAMATAAAVTTELRVAPLVLACDFRHPATIARELATIDLLSEGRLEVGLGAGWKRSDYDSSGIPMDRPGVRVTRMIEHATILKGLFTNDSFTFHGEHYTVTDLPGEPRTHSGSGPPFLIGGGAPRVLRFAGRFADIVGVNPSIHSGEIDTAAAQDGLPERIDEKFSWVAEGVAERDDGRRAGDLDHNAWLAAAEITDDRDGVAELVAAAFGVDASLAVSSPVVLVGTESQVAEELRTRRERWGYNYTVIPGASAAAFAPVVAELTGT
jgi:probable F420-dependent oxidoreductase